MPSKVKFIGTDAFSQLNIKKIKLPKGLSGLGAAFRRCDWLEEIDIPEGITTIKPGTFSCCYALKRVNLPGSVTDIGEGAFTNCASLDEIQIPEGVTQIGERAFENCKALKTIRFPSGVKSIHRMVCLNCEKLERVIVADGVEVIEHTAFCGCTSLKKMSLPASVKKIEYGAFEKCIALESITMLNQNCNIDFTAFRNCPKLIDEAGMKIIAGVLLEYAGEGGLNEIVIPFGVKTIYSAAFKGCEKLNKITFEDGVETIYENAFEDCKDLSEITLPETVKSLGTRAFAGCENLTSVVIPRTVESINPDVFKGCSNLKDIFVEEGNNKYSDVDGILYNAEKTTLIYCPAGKELKEFIVADNVYAIADHAFIDCEKLKKVVIPATVKEIGSEVFVRNLWHNKTDLEDIQIAVGAGSSFVGEAVIDFPYGDAPLVYPTIPVLFPKEHTTRVRLGLGFCQSPEKYSGDYAEEYRKYAKSHQKTLLKKAFQLELKAVEDYFNLNSGDNEKCDIGYKPNLTLKKPNELQKVEILEEVIQKGTLEDLKAVLRTYKTFEMMARALGLAARYRGVDFVRELIEHGATFIYNNDSVLQRKYTMNQKTASGSYSTEYYLMLVSEKLSFSIQYSPYEYTPLCGVSYMNIAEESEAMKLPLKDRLDVVKFLSENKNLGVSLDEMLFWALITNELDFADALIEMGVNLQKTPPRYYTSWGEEPTYMDMITTGSQSVYWTSFVFHMTHLKTEQVLPVFKRFNTIVKSAGNKLILTQTLFDELNWSDESLAFALDNFDLSKINRKKVLETAVSINGIKALEKLAEADWISQPARRENLIEFARENKKTEALAWLMDYKNRTVDVAAEAAKAEAKMLKELTEDPNSVSALKKIWSYKKSDNGTLIITSYKGNSTEVEVPSVIGKTPVTIIAENAFSASVWNGRIKNKNERKKIVSVVIPEGVTEIATGVFKDCDELVKIVLPASLKKLATPLACDCKKLTEVNIPEKVEIVGNGVLFVRCDMLHDKNGCIIDAGRLLCHTENNGWSRGFGRNADSGNITIPEGVVEIAGNVFSYSNMRSVTFPETLKTIGENAFKMCNFITDLEIPGSIETIKTGAFRECSKLKTIKIKSGTVAIGAEAFYSCYRLCEVYIPKSVKKIGKEIFGVYDKNGGMVYGIRVHTQEGAPIVEYLKKYRKVSIDFDYDE